MHLNTLSKGHDSFIEESTISNALFSLHECHICVNHHNSTGNYELSNVKGIYSNENSCLNAGYHGLKIQKIETMYLIGESYHTFCIISSWWTSSSKKNLYIVNGLNGFSLPN